MPLKIRIGSRPSSSLRIGAHQLDAGRVRQPQIEDDQIDGREVGADPRQQLGRALDGHRAVAGGLERAAEPVANKRRVVGDEDRLRRERSAGHLF